MLPDATWVRPPARGRLHRSRRAVQIVTSLLFIVAPFVGILRFDLKHGALILFGASFGLRELGVAYLVVLLFILLVFAGALLYGRIYCGWLCPQTTLSELVAGFERRFFKHKKTSRWRKPLVAAGAFALAGFVSWSLVSYFLDPGDRYDVPVAAWTGWGLTTLVIGADLAWLRHRFCVGICPYGILQTIIHDHRTLGMQFDEARRAECTNCTLCYRACFMGVDIRTQSFDPRCLNCGDCVSATRLAKTCPEEPLIRFRYGTGASTWPRLLQRLGIFDGRRAVVMSGVVVVAVLIGWLTLGRADLELSLAAQYELAELDATGVARNSYRLSVANHRAQALHLDLAVRDLQDLTIDTPAQGLALAPFEHSVRTVVLSATRAAPGAVHPITVVATVPALNFTSELSARFFVPSRRR